MPMVLSEGFAPAAGPLSSHLLLSLQKKAPWKDGLDQELFEESKKKSIKNWSKIYSKSIKDRSQIDKIWFWAVLEAPREGSRPPRAIFERFWTPTWGQLGSKLGPIWYQNRCSTSCQNRDDFWMDFVASWSLLLVSIWVQNEIQIRA